MKKTCILSAAAAAIAVIAAMTGCESEKVSDSQLSISPSSATVAPGGTVTLTASGGWDYTWRIASGSGTLSSYNGKKVTYTASSASYTPTPSSSSTNSTSKTLFVKADESSTTTSTTIVSVKSGDLEATATITVKGN